MGELLFSLYSEVGSKGQAPILLDIGVNVGQTLVSFKSFFPDGEYRGFEPISASVYYVECLIRKNSISKSLIVPIGLSDYSGVSAIYVSDNNPTGSGSTMSAGIKSLEKKVTHYASVSRLDDVFGYLDIAHVDLIKIDVEGMEPAVLRGGSE